MSDGLRLLPAGAIVVSRALFGDWAVGGVDANRHGASRLRLVTWCSPLILPLVLGPNVEHGIPATGRLETLRQRMRRSHPHVAVLRMGGILTLAALVLGIPWLTARSGMWGLLLGVALVALLSVVQAVVAIVALRRLGVTLARSALTSAKYLWPFTAPRAAEDVMHRVVAGVPALILLHELLTPEAFRDFARPILFDAVMRGEETEDVATLRAHLGESRIAEIVNRPPKRDGDAYCPRCGTSFYRGTRFCSDCAEVELRPHAAV